MRNLPAEVLSLSPNLPRVTVVPYQRHFTYDHIFGPDTSQQDVFNDCVSRLMDKFLDGYNATILAYGQTSSGKTFTMGTGLGEGYADSENTRGIVPRAAAFLFNYLHKMPSNAFKYQVQVSFLEIYNEDLIDLLSITSRDGPRNTVTIREDTRGNIIWTGIRERRVNSMEELLDCLESGSALRQTGSTDMNEASSRSHAIFSVSLKQEKWVPNEPDANAVDANEQANGAGGSRLPTRAGTPSLGDRRAGTPTGRRSALGGRATPSGLPRPGSMYSRGPTAAPEPTPNGPETGNGQWVVMQSKFHFVDLAGSERLKRTNAVGDRAREGISINAGLSALGNVISALGDTTKKSVHIPYRDSKLTRLLQDSLGGNSQTLMIACASPAASNLTETINTLKYANRARNIKNQVTQNQEMSLDVDYLQAQIAKLKGEIRQLKSMSMASDDTDYMQQAVNHESSFLRKRNESLEQELEKVNISYTQLEAHFETVSIELTQLQEQQELWRQQQTAALVRSTTGSSVESQDQRAARGSNLANIRTMTESGSSNFQREVEPVIEEYEKVVSALEEQLNEAREAIAAAEAQAQITAAKLRFEETVRESNAIVIAELKSRVGELHERESGSVAYIRELETKVRGGIVEELNEDTDQLRRELAKERGEVNRLRQELQTHNDPDVLALVETVTELEEKIQLLQKGAESRQRRRRIPQANGIARPQTEIFLMVKGQH
ncbi:P-loop containing nucleoside triphosphate hydrolase protein [Syncephalis fuscata]|nr:P-loop containing nucleoside triphosphate hydrolase protein [Syncephalis fuscata]